MIYGSSVSGLVKTSDLVEETFTLKNMKFKGETK